MKSEGYEYRVRVYNANGESWMSKALTRGQEQAIGHARDSNFLSVLGDN